MDNFIEKDFNNLVFLKILIPFILGIVIQSYCPIVNGLWLFGLIALWGFLLLLYFLSVQPTLKVGLLIIAFVLLGYVRSQQLNANGLEEKHKGTFVVLVENVFKTTESYIAYRGELVSQNADINEKGVLVYVKSQSFVKEFEPGNLISFKGELSPPLGCTLPGEFNYANYLNSEGVTFTTFVDAASINLVSEVGKRTWRSLSAMYQHKVRAKFKSFDLDDEELSLLMALTMGIKSSMSPEIKLTFAKGGAMHILAVSGFHVGIVYLFLHSILFPVFFLPKGKYIHAFLGIVGLWGFAFLAGFSSSVSRAVLMFTIYNVGILLGKRSISINTVLAAAFVLLFISPTDIYQPGFQLSFVAVAGLVLFYPPLFNLVKTKNKFLNLAVSLVLVSFVAQLVTLPVSVYYFNQLALYGVLTNLIITLFVYLILGCAILLPLLSLSPLALGWGAVLMKWSILSLKQGVSFVAHLPGAVIYDVYFTEIQSFVILAFMLGVFLTLRYRSKTWLFYSQLLAICLVLSFFIRKQHVARHNALAVYQSYGKQCIALVQNGKGYFISENERVIFPKYFLKWGINPEDVSYLSWNGVFKDKEVLLKHKALFFADGYYCFGKKRQASSLRKSNLGQCWLSLNKLMYGEGANVYNDIYLNLNEVDCLNKGNGYCEIILRN